MTASSAATPTAPTRKQIKRWQRYLANERAEAAVYRELALKKQGEEREILLGIAEAEARHEEHWRTLLGDHVGMPRRPDYSTLLMGFLAKRFGSVFTLALMQSAEARTPYEKDDDATDQMTADERIHAEVVRGLAAKSREKMSGNFRAAVFGANDGLVSNLALVLGVVGSGVDTSYVLLTGISGLLAGALSMGAGEYVSVCSQRELLEASAPSPDTDGALPKLDINANDFGALKRFALDNDVQMVVVGPEDPLVNGIYDDFKNDARTTHIPVIGPSRKGATLEGSKDFAKAFMARPAIPPALHKTLTRDWLFSKN